MLSIQKRLTNVFYVLLSFPASAMGFALSVQIAALSWLLGTQYGLNIEEIGLVWAAGPIAGIFGQIIFGVISDQVWFWNGRRRPFILIGGILAALSLIALPNIDIIAGKLGFDGILGVAIMVALTLDLSINVGFNPTRSIIADVTPEGEQRTKGYTWMQTISGTLGMMAYVIGAIWGNYVLIYSGAILVFLLSIIPPFLIQEPRELQTEEDKEATQGLSQTSIVNIFNSIQPLWGFLIYGVYGIITRLAGFEKGASYEELNNFMRVFCLTITVIFVFRALAQSGAGKTKSQAGMIGFKKVLAAHAFTWLGIQTMFVYMFSYVENKLVGFSDDDLGRVVSISFLVLNGVAAILPAFVLEPITRKIGRVKTHFYCIGIMAFGYAGMWFFGQSPYIIYGLMAILGVGWAATISLPFAIMSQQVDQARMGLYMGLFNLSVVLPQLVASLAIGQIISEAADKNIVFIVSTISLALSALAWFFVKDAE